MTPELAELKRRLIADVNSSYEEFPEQSNEENYDQIVAKAQNEGVKVALYEIDHLIEPYVGNFDIPTRNGSD